MGLWFSPDSLAVAASDVASIGNTLRTVHGLATLPTTAVAAAGLDEVSAAIAALFGSYGKEYQALSAQAAVFHDQFVQALTGARVAYAGAESANVAPLQGLLDAVNAPSEAIFGRPLIGNGADATTAGANGGAGGILVGTAAMVLRARQDKPAAPAGRLACSAAAAKAAPAESVPRVATAAAAEC
nr:PE family protein [Mycobacterium gordonae]